MPTTQETEAHHLRVLLLEENRRDAEMILQALREAGFIPNARQVETEHDFLAGLEDTPDLIIAGCALPRFDGLRAVELTRQRGLDTPFILLSGVAGEEHAVQGIKRGADDYLLKDRLARLGPAVTAALENKRRRDEHRVAEEARLPGHQDYERQLAALVKLARGGFWLVPDESAALREISETAARALNVERVSIWRFNPERTAIFCRNLYEAGPARHSSGQRLEAGQYPAYFRALNESEVIHADDARQDPRTREFTDSYLVPQGITSMLDAPIFLAGVLEGVLCVEHVGAPRRWTPAERAFAVAITHLVSVVLAQQAQSRSEARLRAIVECEPECVKVTSLDGRLLDMNPAGLRMVEAARGEQVFGRPVLELVHPEDRGKFSELHEQAGRGGTGQLQFRLRGLKGTARWVETHATALRAADGTITSVLSVTRDITQRKEAEEKLTHTRARLSNLIQSVEGIVYEADAETFQFTFVSVQAERMLGYPVLQWFDEPEFWINHVHPEDREKTVRFCRECTARKENHTFECRMVAADGRVVWVRDMVRYVEPPGQAPVLRGLMVDITEQKRAEDALRASETNMAAAQRIAHFGSWELELTNQSDINANSLRWSDEMFRIAGYEPGAVPVTNEFFFRLVPPEDHEAIRQAVAAAIHERRQYSVVHRFVRPSGEERVVHERAEVYFDEKTGRPLKMVGTAHDITEQRRNERQVAAFAALGRKLGGVATAVEAAQIIVETADELLGWDACWLQLYDAERDCCFSVLNMDVVEGRRQSVTPACNNQAPSPLVREAIVHGPQLLLREGAPAAPHGLVPFGDNGRPSASLMIVPARHGGEVIAVLSIQSYTRRAYRAEDLATLEALANYCGGALAQIRAREALRQSEERFAAIFHANPTAIAINTIREGRLIEVNERFCQFLGATREELVGRTIPELNVWANPAERDPVMQRVLTEGSVHDLETRLRRRSGELREVIASFERIDLLDETEPVLIAQVTDITERKQAEEKLREQATLLDKAQDAIIVRGLDHRILYWNKSAERLYGWTAAEAVGCSIQELLYREPTFFDQATETVLAKGEWVGELTQFTKAGQELIVQGRWTLVRDDRSRPKSILAINTDLTEKKKFEAQLLRTQRMESIGTLAGGIAHDLNNVLAPILMSIGMLKLNEADEERLKLLASIEASAKRGADMVRQVLSFARGMEGERLTVDLRHVGREITKIIRDTFPKNVELQYQAAKDLWMVEADPTQLHQVLMNLCVNARDAMPLGGRLTLSLKNTVVDEVYAGMNPQSKPGNHVVITVQDTGMGIPKEVQDRMFEPFYTTKEIGKGTGLGLATVLTIVKGHGGFINVYSEPGQGATFKVYLPALAGNAAESERVAV
jgi:PAS domain S-box-containing protein